MRALITSLAFFAATGASAHPGHLAEADGHSHVLALVAVLGAAALVIAPFVAPRVRRFFAQARTRRRNAG